MVADQLIPVKIRLARGSQRCLRRRRRRSHPAARHWPCRNRRKHRRSSEMIGKVFAGIATAGVLAGVLATGAMAAPAATAAASPAKAQRPAAKDVFGGTVTAISATELTVKNAKAGSETFLRTDATVVVKGRNEKSNWSEIEISSHVMVRYEERDGKLYAKRVHIGRAHVAGKVESVNGNVITIRTRDGKDVK